MMPLSRDLRLAPQARHDVEAILSYSLVTYGVDRWDDYKVRLDRAFNRLAEFPEIGRDRPELGADLRSHTVERHVVVYLVTRDAVVMVRGLSARQDIRAAFPT